MKNLKQLTKKTVAKAAAIGAAASALPMKLAYATSINENIGEQGINVLMGSFIDFVLSITMYVGIFIILFGVYQFYMAFTESNPDGKIKGITFVVAGICLTAIKAVLSVMNVLG